MGDTSSAGGGSRDRARSARAFERKRRAPRWARWRERESPLAAYFGGGLELDERVDPDRYAVFVEDFLVFRDILDLSAGWGAAVELKFRRLGRHRADGLFYPRERVLVVDTGSHDSFAHEFGHLVDFLALGERCGPRLMSGEEWFTRCHALMLSRMGEDGSADPRLSDGRGRLSWRYFAGRAECFARAFEQLVSEVVPGPSSLAGEPSRYRSDPLYFREIPSGLADRMLDLLRAGPR